MIEFRNIELIDRKRIEEYIESSDCRSCFLSFTHLYCWPGYFETKWAVIDDFLVFRIVMKGTQELCYLQPIGKGDFSHILSFLAEDAAKNFGQPLQLYILGDLSDEYVTSMGRGDYAVYKDRAFTEYIYWADQLRMLPGRKYQAKRNHFKNFTARYSYRYEKLEPRHFEACLQLDNKWRRIYELHADDNFFYYDRQALEKALIHWDELELLGGALYVDDTLVAFTYGGKINHDTFDILMEKGDLEYQGVYAAINKLFLEHLPSKYLYVNREEDMGVEGLRLSKLSYHPTMLLPLVRMLQLGNREKRCKALWKEVFQDEDETIDDFFINYYRSSQLFTVRQGDQIISMLYVVPFKMNNFKVGYVYAVATLKKERRKGYATQLLHQAMEWGKQEGFEALVLIPESDGLYDYYARIGFRGKYPVSFVLPNSYDFGFGDKEREQLCILPLHTEFNWPENGEKLVLKFG